MTDYKGIVKDQMGSLPDRKTKNYSTYRDAHEAAEKLCKQTYGERGTIDVRPIGPGRPAMPPDEKRKNRSFKVTDDEWARIGELAKEAGLNISEYIRRQTLGKTM